MKEKILTGIKGTVKSRLCECCNHHEIGIETPDGKFIALKPGMKVEIIEDKN